MAQQTAVSWLVDIIERYTEHLSEEDLENLLNIFQQAKAMEKEQIIKAASNDKVFQIAKYLVDGEESNLSLFEWRNMIKRDAEQYYNETFKK